MIYVLYVIWTAWLLVTALAAGNVWHTEWQRRRQDARYKSLGDADRPSVVVVACLKGFHEEHTPRFLRSLCRQNYGPYRVILAFEDESEPAINWIAQNLESRERNDTDDHAPIGIECVIAGHATNQAQKVHNQIAAFRKLTEEDQLIAFADADIFCGTDWLDKLTEPVRYGGYEFSSGNRFPLPLDGRVSTLCASKMLLGVCTIANLEMWNLGWGGSMVITRRAFEELQVPDAIAGCLSDDLQISRAARKNGFPISRRMSLFVASPVAYSWRQLYEFGTRQYYHTRKYTWTTYALAAYANGIYTAGFLSALVAGCLENSLGWWAIVLATAFDQIRAFGRRYLLSQCVPDENRPFRRKSALVEHFLTPLWVGLHFCLIIGAGLKKSITWGGITYDVQGRTKTRILHDPRTPLSKSAVTNSNAAR